MSFEELLTLQTLDTRLDQLAYQRTHHETFTQRAVATEAVVAATAALEDNNARRSVVQAELDRLDGEAQAARDKSTKLNDTLYSGTVVAHKDLESIQAEIAMLAERVEAFEDHELEQMELLEPIDAERAEAIEALNAANAALEEVERSITVMLAETDAEEAQVSEQRTALASTLADDLLARYEDLRSKLGGQGAARLAPGGKCEGCHLTLPSAEYSELKRAPADQIVTCPECGRILVR